MVTKTKKPIFLIFLFIAIGGIAIFLTSAKGKEFLQKLKGEDPSTTPGDSGSTDTGSGFPIQWGKYNPNTILVQQKINAILKQGKVTTTGLVAEDGILGTQTVKGLSYPVPNIAKAVEKSRTISEAQFKVITQ